MKKRIKDIYIYRDWRTLFRDDFIARTSASTGYSLRAYARDLELSPGFVSRVLNGNKPLTISTSEKVLGKLGFSGDELLYAKSLVVMDIASDDSMRNEAFDYVSRHTRDAGFKSDPTRDLFISSANHFLVYGTARKFPELEKIYSILSKLKVGRKTVDKIVEEFVRAGYLSVKDRKIEVKDMRVFIAQHKSLFQLADQLNHLLNVVMSEGVDEMDAEANNHTFAIGLDENSFKLAHEAHKHYLRTLRQLSESTLNADRMTYLVNSFFTVKLVTE